MNVTNATDTVNFLPRKLSPKKAESEAANTRKPVTKETSAASSSAPAEMSMEEYKSYIHDKISGLPVHPTQINRSASVFISEDGFAAMKNDPAYEEWVIGKLREDFAAEEIRALVLPHVENHARILAAAESCDRQKVYDAFRTDPNAASRGIPDAELCRLADDMLAATAAYLPAGWQRS